MRTNIDIAIESNTKDAVTWYFDVDPNDDNTDWVEFNELSEERRAEVCKKYGVTEEFITDLLIRYERIAAAIHDDLADIWKRLDGIENGGK